MPVSKLEAAQRQLDCAIRLLFNLDDMPSVITLSRAAFRVLFDIYPVLKPNEKFDLYLDQIIRNMGWSKFNRIANQLKHADNDAKAMIDTHPLHAMTGIGIAITLYHQITETYTPEMRAFETLMTVVDPSVFTGPHDPKAVGYQDYMRAVEAAKNATHEQLMEMGRGFLYTHRTGQLADRDPNPPTNTP